MCAMQADGVLQQVALDEALGHNHNGTVADHEHGTVQISRMFTSVDGSWSALLNDAVLMYRCAWLLCMRATISRL